MSSGVYALGYVIVIAGVLYIAHLMHIPQQWIFAIGIVLLGMGIVTGVQSSKRGGSS